MSFQCQHCGYCCTDRLVPINLTLGDLYRFSKILQQPLENFFPNFISILPFRGLDPTVYSPELGIKKPCLKRNSQCTIYQARPLNCRIFPYWLLGIKEAWPETPCTEGLKMTADDLKKYKMYKDALGKIILEEDKITEKFLKQFFQDIDLSKSADYPVEKDQRRQEIKKQELAQSMIRFDFQDFVKKIRLEIEKNKTFFEENHQKIEEAEKILSG